MALISTETGCRDRQGRPFPHRTLTYKDRALHPLGCAPSKCPGTWWDSVSSLRDLDDLGARTQRLRAGLRLCRPSGSEAGWGIGLLARTADPSAAPLRGSARDDKRKRLRDAGLKARATRALTEEVKARFTRALTEEAKARSTRALTEEVKARSSRASLRHCADC